MNYHNPRDQHFVTLTEDPTNAPNGSYMKKTKPRGLRLTLKYLNIMGQPTIPPTQPITIKHEGGVPQKKSKSKKGLEWSPLLVQQKNSGGQQEEGHGIVHHVQ